MTHLIIQPFFVVIGWIIMAIKWTIGLCGIAENQKKVLVFGKTIVKHDHVTVGHSQWQFQS